MMQSSALVQSFVVQPATMIMFVQKFPRGIAQVGLQSEIPVLFGVLTTDTIEQAIERAGTKAGNKGYDCAMSALEMANLLEAALKKYPQTKTGKSCLTSSKAFSNQIRIDE